jgi:hypothetical protein
MGAVLGLTGPSIAAHSPVPTDDGPRPYDAYGRTATTGLATPTPIPPTVGQVDERIRAGDDTLNAPQQLATSQDRAVIDVVRDALIRHRAAS